ncbi:nucleotide pyrophosphohydrolase [uncultured Porphyromonas sp.]|uniref:nucleotide pyrophosphohydrolase n=1 Tax=uncultured Porphyromonas sp. TaxID=159274 RepID=UPI00262AB119|nr:nucleotide pyrophosphohydrolase [uncultured Porphyromonas sp.]
MDATDKARETTLNELQRLVDEWIRTYGVRYFDPLTNMAILTEETGEVARVMARLYGEQSAKASDHLDLADELADLLWVLTCIANQCGVNLQEALEKNLQKKTKRDATRHLNNDKLRSKQADRTE